MPSSPRREAVPVGTRMPFETSAFLASIIESTEDAIITKTIDGTITSWNPAAERLYGYTPEEAVGRNISLIVPPGRPDEIPEILRRLARGERVEHFETVRVRKDGRRVQISLAISPIRGEDGRVIGASAIARDVTERKRVEEQLRRRTRELAVANQRKNDFLAVLGHELRNPLGAIGNAVAVAEAAAGNADVVRESLGILKGQSQQITRLADDLLDVARIGRGTVKLERSPIELGPVIECAVESVKPQIEGRGQRLTVELPDEPVCLEADPVRIGQVVSNLLANASKYSHAEGRIWLSARREGEQLELRVRDEGSGIEPEFLPHVFELFAQGSAGQGRPAPGLGLGLTLVQQLVKLHGGDVEARSEGRGKGSEFRVRLPLMPERVEAGEEAGPRAAAETTSVRLRVLLVDDHEEAVNALATLLEIWGHEVRTAVDGPSALAAARELEPQLVLLDIGLPEMDGWEVARRLRRQPETATAILVALTGYGRQADRARSHDAGFDHHLIKPVHPDRLRTSLSEWFP